MLDLYCTDSAQNLITAGKDPDDRHDLHLHDLYDLDRDVSVLGVKHSYLAPRSFFWGEEGCAQHEFQYEKGFRIFRANSSHKLFNSKFVEFFFFWRTVQAKGLRLGIFKWGDETGDETSRCRTAFRGQPSLVPTENILTIACQAFLSPRLPYLDFAA